MTTTGTVIASIARRRRDRRGGQRQRGLDVDGQHGHLRTSTAPTVTINQAVGQADPTNASPINFTVVVQRAVTGFATGDVTHRRDLGRHQDRHASPARAPTYNVAVTGMTDVRHRDRDASPPSVRDRRRRQRATPPRRRPTTPSPGTSSPPTVTINQAAAQVDPTNASPINFTVVFSESVTGFATGDVTLTAARPADRRSATVTGIGHDLQRRRHRHDRRGHGRSRPSPRAWRIDTAGNGNTASTSTDNTVTWDNVAPTVTINQAAGQADPTNATPINFTVVFSEPVTGFVDRRRDLRAARPAARRSATVTGSRRPPTTSPSPA